MIGPRLPRKTASSRPLLSRSAVCWIVVLLCWCCCSAAAVMAAVGCAANFRAGGGIFFSQLLLSDGEPARRADLAIRCVPNLPMTTNADADLTLPSVVAAVLVDDCAWRPCSLLSFTPTPAA